jgi:hypothetical protein
MYTTEIAAEGLLRHVTALAEGSRNLEIMDLTAILHGYLELTKFDPTNPTYRQNLEDAVATVLATVECGGCAASI